MNYTSLGKLATSIGIYCQIDLISCQFIPCPVFIFQQTASICGLSGNVLTITSIKSKVCRASIVDTTVAAIIAWAIKIHILKILVHQATPTAIIIFRNIFCQYNSCYKNQQQIYAELL
ncbi:UNKNOWN [Stylonychia lemnae]|uniref:Uncharacterized protein n=1 Tax=Stylonychia lemnae TaxID=5949 RepID=A0A077ZRZ2_STYLE|nr:UNKNOWN [Stylonychia lemnae]|eukprot:CDW72249.1 UNKNOWN [Stylonychia lemnae]